MRDQGCWPGASTLFHPSPPRPEMAGQTWSVHPSTDFAWVNDLHRTLCGINAAGIAISFNPINLTMRPPQCAPRPAFTTPGHICVPEDLKALRSLGKSLPSSPPSNAPRLEICELLRDLVYQRAHGTNERDGSSVTSLSHYATARIYRGLLS